MKYPLPGGVYHSVTSQALDTRLGQSSQNHRDLVQNRSVCRLEVELSDRGNEKIRGEVGSRKALEDRFRLVGLRL